MVIGFPNIKYSNGVCQGCILGKHPEENFEKGKAWRASSTLELVHSDITGPFPHPSMSRAKYVLTFIDDWSRYTWVYFLKKKSKVFECFRDFKISCREAVRKGIKILHTDNGGEYVNKYVQHLCVEVGILVKAKLTPS
jgi:transposase InsO family protein